MDIFCVFTLTSETTLNAWYPTGIYLFNINNEKTETMYEFVQS